MYTILNELTGEWDEIESIEYIGEEDTIDINLSGNRLFYANDILTHNCAVEAVEFDHSHISGGLSKIMTADNVIGIFSSITMKERGRVQIQFMKTRSSTGLGQKVELSFNVNSMRITDLDEDADAGTPTTADVMFNKLKRQSAQDATSSASAKTNSNEVTSVIARTEQMRNLLRKN